MDVTIRTLDTINKLENVLDNYKKELNCLRNIIQSDMPVPVNGKVYHNCFIKYRKKHTYETIERECRFVYNTKFSIVYDIIGFNHKLLFIHNIPGKEFMIRDLIGYFKYDFQPDDNTYYKNTLIGNNVWYDKNEVIRSPGEFDINKYRIHENASNFVPESVRIIY